MKSHDLVKVGRSQPLTTDILNNHFLELIENTPKFIKQLPIFQLIQTNTTNWLDVSFDPLSRDSSRGNCISTLLTPRKQLQAWTLPCINLMEVLTFTHQQYRFFHVPYIIYATSTTTKGKSEHYQPQHSTINRRLPNIDFFFSFLLI